MKSLKRIWAVAGLTAAQGLRQPLFFMLFFAAAGLVALSPKFAVFHLNEGAKMVTDLGLSTALTFSSLLALLTASATVSDEIDGRTALTMLSKPLRREEFILGKYLGVALCAAAFNLLLSTVLLATHRGQLFDDSVDAYFANGVLWAAVVMLAVFGGGMGVRLLAHRGWGAAGWFWAAYAAATAVLLLYLPHKPQNFSTNLMASPRWDFRLLTGLLFTALHACVLSAFAVALATRLTLVQSAIGTAAFFVLGHASGMLLSPFRNAENSLSVAGLFVRGILPDLDQFNVTDALANAYIDAPLPIPWDVTAGAAAYAACYSIALLALAAGLFANRELS